MCLIAGTAALSACGANPSPLERLREFAGAKATIAGLPLSAVQEARRSVDPTLPTYATLTPVELATLEIKCATCLAAAATCGSSMSSVPSGGIGQRIQSTWTAGRYGSAWTTRLGATQAPGNSLEQLQANWFFRKTPA
jgi:hypothetical protein